MRNSTGRIEDSIVERFARGVAVSTARPEYSRGHLLIARIAEKSAASRISPRGQRLPPPDGRRRETLAWLEELRRHGGTESPGVMFATRHVPFARRPCAFRCGDKSMSYRRIPLACRLKRLRFPTTPRDARYGNDSLKLSSPRTYLLIDLKKDFRPGEAKTRPKIVIRRVKTSVTNHSQHF